MFDEYIESVLIFTGIHIIAAYSFYVPFKTGQISLGQAGFMAVGAYAGGIMTTKLGIPFPVALIMAGLIAGLVGVFVGFPALRIKGIYLLLLTLGFSEIIQVIMETELENVLERHEAGKGMLDALGRYAPAFGMIGTLIGLVAMLSNMDDPSKIGAGMAAALLTTLYGALLANIMFLPMADKLALRSSEEALSRTIIIQGVMAIQSGDNPRAVESKLMTFLPPGQRPVEEEEAA